MVITYMSDWIILILLRIEILLTKIKLEKISLSPTYALNTSWADAKHKMFVEF